MADFSLVDMIGGYLAVVIPILLVLIGLVVLYYVLLIRAVLQMLRKEAPNVLVTFAFIALVPIPFALLLGIAVLIIWHYLKKDLVL